MRGRGEGMLATSKTILECEITHNKEEIIGVGNIKIMEKAEN